MAPKTKTAGHGAAKATPQGTAGGSQDPMLQGTYLHDEADDFESPSHELDEFDERLTAGEPAHSPQSGGKNVSAAAAAGSGARAVAMQKKRLQGGDKAAHRPPMRSSFGAPGTAPTSGNDARRTSVTEEEADAHVQLQQDIDDVRNLDARFGTADDSDDSD